MKNIFYIFIVLVVLPQFSDVYGMTDKNVYPLCKKIILSKSMIISRDSLDDENVSIAYKKERMKDTIDARSYELSSLSDFIENTKISMNRSMYSCVTNNRLSSSSDKFIKKDNEIVDIDEEIYNYVINPSDQTIDWQLIKIYHSIYYYIGCKNDKQIDFENYFTATEANAYNINLECIKDVQNEITTNCLLLYVHKYYLSIYDIEENNEKIFQSLWRIYDDIKSKIFVRKNKDRKLFSLKNSINALNALIEIYQNILNTISQDKIIVNKRQFVEINNLANDSFFYMFNLKNCSTSEICSPIVVNILHKDALSCVNQYLFMYYASKLNGGICLKTIIPIGEKHDLMLRYSEKSQYNNIRFGKKLLPTIYRYLSLRDIGVNQMTYFNLGNIMSEFFVHTKYLELLDKSFFKNYPRYDSDIKNFSNFQTILIEKKVLNKEDIVNVFESIVSFSSYAIKSQKTLQKIIFDNIQPKYFFDLNALEEEYASYYDLNNTIKYCLINKLFHVYKEVIFAK